MLEMKTALTADIGILEAGITALLGYAVVFFGLVLLMGVVSGAAIMLASGSIVPEAGQTVLSQLLRNVGSNMAGMFETCMVAVLVAALCALIRANGGFDALLSFIKQVFRGKRGGQLGMGLMVAAMDVATANNTVAIVMANPIAKEMSRDYGITP
jgi:Na+/H+ antiporter NhaC